MKTYLKVILLSAFIFYLVSPKCSYVRFEEGRILQVNNLTGNKKVLIFPSSTEYYLVPALEKERTP